MRGVLPIVSSMLLHFMLALPEYIRYERSLETSGNAVQQQFPVGATLRSVSNKKCGSRCASTSNRFLFSITTPPLGKTLVSGGLNREVQQRRVSRNRDDTA